MTGVLQIATTLLLVFAAAVPLGGYVFRVMEGERVALSRAGAPVERLFYRLSGVEPAREQSWFVYTMSMLAFSLVGFLSLYALQRLQNVLPLNPQGFDAVAPDLAFNTALSFITNTNWQNYSGETTMSHLTQMLGLTVHNFLSAATGLAMAFALTRGFSRATSPTVGNFWVDMTRATLYILLPLAVVVALALVMLGAPQTLTGAFEATTLEGAKQVQSGDLRHRGRLGRRDRVFRARRDSPHGRRALHRADRGVALVHRAVRQFRGGGGGGTRQGAGRRAAPHPERDRRQAADRPDRQEPAWSWHVSALDLKIGDIVLVEAGDIVPGDGEVIEGVASVNESAITGESAPVIREAGGDRSAVTGGTTVLSDWIKVRITAAPGSTFIDRMIALVEGAQRQKTPNELALSILLSGLTIIFLIVCVTLWPLAVYSGTTLSVSVLIALLVCLIPTTIGGLLSAIGIAGMDRLIRFNVIATSGRAVEAAGDVDTLLLDKTGTITFGNRMADEFIPVGAVGEAELAEAVLLASLADETPEGRSIVALASNRHGVARRR